MVDGTTEADCKTGWLEDAQWEILLVMAVNNRDG